MNSKKSTVLTRARSFKYAFKGIRLMLKNQPNFYIQLTFALAALLLSYLLGLSRSEFLWIIISIGIVLSAEMVNTAIEKITDLVQPEYDEKAGQIKDIAAGAVLVLAITAAAIGLLIFIPRIIDLF